MTHDIGDAARAARDRLYAMSQAGPPPEARAPAFPMDALPPGLRAYVAAAAASLACPPEMIAVPMLGFAGSLIGNRLSLRLKASWHEYPTFYIAVVAPPGSAKSPALAFAQWPLDALQNDAERIYRQQKLDYETKLDDWRQSRETDRGEKPAHPQLRDYFSTNLTLEALVGMLDRAPGVAIVKDEILGWVQSMDQYRAKGSDRQEYLSLWSSKSIKVDRKGAEPIYRRFPVASVVGGIQPDMAAGLHTQHQERDGFVERLLPIVPDCRPMPWNDETVDAARYADVADLFRALDALPAATETDDDAGGGVGLSVRLSAEARAEWVAWFNDNTALVAEASGIVAGFYSKLPAYVARLALVLHALWTPDDPRVLLSAARMSDAIELGEFFRDHIHRFVALLQAPASPRFAGTQTRIARILRKPESQTAGGWVARTTILDGLRNVPAETLTEVLAAMEAAGSIERQMVASATKPVEQWRLANVFPPFGDSEFSEYLSAPDARNPEYPESPNGVKDHFATAEYEELTV